MVGGATVRTTFMRAITQASISTSIRRPAIRRSRAVKSTKAPKEDIKKIGTGHRVGWTLAVLAFALAGQASATTYVVDRFDDSTVNACTSEPNDCTLRGAILQANANSGDDIILLDGGTYALSIVGAYEDQCWTGDLDVLDTLLIEGRGPENTVIDAGGDGGINDRVFDVHVSGLRLTLRGMTVTGGSPDTELGGGIRALDGSLRLETCVVSGNELPNMNPGVAIYSMSDAPGDLTEIVDTWITGNTGPWTIVSLRTARIERSTVSGNMQTITARTVDLMGAGSLLLNSTFGGNAAPAGSVSVVISNTGTEIIGCTITNQNGPALSIAAGASATMSNTLIAGWCTGTGQLTTLGGNLESPGGNCQLGAGDLDWVADPGISALDFFGGPTPVYRPLAGSPALDAPVAALNCPVADQRGLSRPRDGGGTPVADCDIGAVELAGAGEIFVESFESGFLTPWFDVVQ
jgi:hypothetical protein